MSDLRNQLKNVNDRADELVNNPSELTKDALLAQLRWFYDVVKGLELEHKPIMIQTPKAKPVAQPQAPVAEPMQVSEPVAEPSSVPVAKKVAKADEPELLVDEAKAAAVMAVETIAPVEKVKEEVVVVAVEESLSQLPVVEQAAEVVKKPQVEPSAEVATVEEKPKAKKEPLIGKDEAQVDAGDRKILAGQFNSTPLSDLRSAIPLNEKFGIIRNLFKGNASDFGDAVLKLNNASNAKEVNIYMELLKQRFEWDERTESYQNFRGYVDRKALGLSPSNANSDQ